MSCCRPTKGRFDFSAITGKILGVITFAFCLGTLTGLFLPVGFLAVLETALLVMLAYFCLFKL